MFTLNGVYNNYALQSASISILYAHKLRLVSNLVQHNGWNTSRPRHEHTMTEGRVSVGFLRGELHRLLAEEEVRKREYFGHRSDLQEIWDKLTSLKTHINKFQTDVENAKIEEIMREAGSAMATNFSSSAESVRGGMRTFSIESAERVAHINKLKEQLRLKDVLRGRVSSLEEKIIEGRKQLYRVTEALKSTPVSQSVPSTPSTSQLNGADGDNSVSRSLALRQAILTISDKVNTWEDELVHARSDLKQVEATIADDLSAVTGGGRGSYSTGMASATQSSSGKGVVTDSALQTVRSSRAPSASGITDDALVDIVSHGPPLTATLAAALRSGTSTELSSTSTLAGADAAQLNMLQECEFSVYEVAAGQATVHRINGEAPSLYIMRLQRRLGSLLTLELQIQLEFQAKLAMVRQSRDMVRILAYTVLRNEVKNMLYIVNHINTRLSPHSCEKWR
jgi:phage shock protein A